MTKEENLALVDPVKANDEEKAKPSKPNNDKPQEEELSEEDLQLKTELEMLVERLKEDNKGLYKPALESLRSFIKTATSSMTSVPKPLKYLRPHYPDLQNLYENWESGSDKSLFAEILSVLAMTYSDTGKRETLLYRIHGHCTESPGSWGHEYVRHLAAEIGEVYQYLTLPPGEVGQAVEEDDPIKPFSKALEELPASLSKAPSQEQLLELAMDLVPFFLRHNAEPDAVDLLLELESIEKIASHVDSENFQKTCLYLISVSPFLEQPDDTQVLRVAHDLYHSNHRYPEAIVLAMRLNDRDLIKSDFKSPTNKVMQKQLAFLLARQHVPIEWVKEEDEEIDGELFECLSNVKLPEYFKEFGKTLGISEPKSLEDVYKTHLETRNVSVDSARGNLAGSFVNAFVNAGFGNDKLMVDADEGNSWIYKNKDDAMLSATASLGVSLLWDPDVGLSHIDKYTYSNEDYIRAGAFLATGLIHNGIKTEVDAPLALLSEQVESSSIPIKVSAIMGLGYAYAGTQREDLMELLIPYAVDESLSMEVASIAILALGYIFVGSCNGDVLSSILQAIMERDPKSLDEKWARFAALGLGLVFVGARDNSDVIVETVKTIEHPFARYAEIMIDICSYAGSSNVLKIQEMLHICSEHIDGEKSSDLHQSFAVLGIAAIAMGEDIGAEMSIRQFNHLMHYGEPIIRKTVPLALGLISASNPQMHLLDSLSKYSHDNDLAVAFNAIFAMGLVGAGSNNARLAQMLRQLASYYATEPDCLLMVRIAQGMVHMGKGSIGVNPFHTDRTLLDKNAFCGLLSTLVAFTDARGFILEKAHWMLYNLTMAMYPRMAVTLDEDLSVLKTTVRVGQAVDVVGQAGKPRTISGFQTHETPVRMANNERAELASEQYLSYNHVLENVVILRKNPGWEDDSMQI
ncbi:26S proteasome regulatory complex, non-ATPase subcomplex, Rpn1 subunit [Wallemia mellicola]|uniref:26S proteasome regulatory subunit RPN1 n=1 Tax=Wallemia mellicola TaxID=1708541 RepID=A0A4T0R6I7_9BASI|nr:hypothetical protein E3Q23_00864 [Wallemia mellicola]TIB82345.1 26S proteasome regulatory complex, non-ATPase subcomplex, Rpn1 subunit [Wallemia mellicola]TIB84884.1 26S proteasome regulatory complex, non-ATPase subcomplex, Rpn1 subunit [Wallemia mellicola]TIB88168.1 26S proteasome regulatory complex, non-ATPase subcomplex, Rpn1 subunit [Wallemia mellicola]TIC03266.1 26S proteasome regulatory complex, non-ATPase subcomplex, Rpn1 subunit [Wallemia mellicola]